MHIHKTMNEGRICTQRRSGRANKRDCRTFILSRSNSTRRFYLQEWMVLLCKTSRAYRLPESFRTATESVAASPKISHTISQPMIQAIRFRSMCPMVRDDQVMKGLCI